MTPVAGDVGQFIAEYTIDHSHFLSAWMMGLFQHQGKIAAVICSHVPVFHIAVLPADPFNGQLMIWRIGWLFDGRHGRSLSVYFGSHNQAGWVSCALWSCSSRREHFSLTSSTIFPVPDF